jgi:hypothetical protein
VVAKEANREERAWAKIVAKEANQEERAWAKIVAKEANREERAWAKIMAKEANREERAWAKIVAKEANREERAWAKIVAKEANREERAWAKEWETLIRARRRVRVRRTLLEKEKVQFLWQYTQVRDRARRRARARRTPLEKEKAQFLWQYTQVRDRARRRARVRDTPLEKEKAQFLWFDPVRESASSLISMTISSVMKNRPMSRRLLLNLGSSVLVFVPNQKTRVGIVATGIYRFREAIVAHVDSSWTWWRVSTLATWEGGSASEEMAQVWEKDLWARVRSQRRASWQALE